MNPNQINRSGSGHPSVAKGDEGVELSDRRHHSQSNLVPRIMAEIKEVFQQNNHQELHTDLPKVPPMELSFENIHVWANIKIGDGFSKKSKPPS